MRLISALRKAQPEVYALTCYSTFVKEITDGGIDLQENVYNALLADLKLGEYMHEHGVFEALIKANAQLRTQDMVTLRSHTDKELVWYSLSAARRQLCLETLPLTAGWQRHHESCLSVICLYLRRVSSTEQSNVSNLYPPLANSLEEPTLRISLARLRNSSSTRPYTCSPRICSCFRSGGT